MPGGNNSCFATTSRCATLEFVLVSVSLVATVPNLLAPRAHLQLSSQAATVCAKPHNGVIRSSVLQCKAGSGCVR